MIRFFDILLSTLAIIFLLPFFLLIMFILLFTGEHKIFFLQQIIGYKKKKFNLIKFATMLENSPKMGTKNITLKNDPRVLPIGKFLRKYKINELPQIFNILKGDMSIVGPRPLTYDIFNLYNSHTKKILSCVKPGLTGVSSIFFRDEEKIFLKKNDIKYYKKFVTPYKAKLEKWYIKNQSLYLYFSCIFATSVSVFFKKINIIKFLFKDFPSPSKDLIKISK
jgi:lipopolysaccharide/colanic/teichoic acid biosynthesis glycosyltransferase